MMHRLRIGILGVLLLGGWGLETLNADASQDAWLRYTPLQSAVRAKYESLPASLVVLGASTVLRLAPGERIDRPDLGRREKRSGEGDCSGNTRSDPCCRPGSSATRPTRGRWFLDSHRASSWLRLSYCHLTDGAGRSLRR